MTRQHDLNSEEKTGKRHKAIVMAVERDLVRSLRDTGAMLTGLSVRMDEYECLITLRAEVDGLSQVAFVGHEDFGGTLLKAVREARAGKLSWRVDKF